MKRGIFYLIIANEFCERYCFYALKSILFTFLRTEYLWTSKKVTFVVHLFVSLCYFCTLIGGFLSDIILGKYKTILYLSLIYLIGTIFITGSSLIQHSSYLLYLGLGLIALGTGGIKPCVAAFGGDQVEVHEGEKYLSVFFSCFYFAINLGSMLSTFIVPLLAELSCNRKDSCYPLAFGSSSLILFVSISLFFMGSNMYIKKKVKTESMTKLCSAIFRHLKIVFNLNDMEDMENTKILQNPEQVNYGKEVMKATKTTVSKIFILFIPITFFWMLYDQQSSSWVEQGLKMENKSTFFTKSFRLIASQMQTFNSLFILLFIPVFSRYIYSAIENNGFKLTPIKKMGTGILLASLSFVFAAFLEHCIYKYSVINQKISILWQIPQYVVLTAGEIMLNMTGLEFAYAEAPDEMKTIILAGWLLTVTFGNIFVVLYTALDLKKILNTNEGETFNFLVYAIIGGMAAITMFKLEKWYSRNK